MSGKTKVEKKIRNSKAEVRNKRGKPLGKDKRKKEQGKSFMQLITSLTSFL